VNSGLWLICGLVIGIGVGVALASLLAARRVALVRGQLVATQQQAERAVSAAAGAAELSVLLAPVQAGVDALSRNAADAARHRAAADATLEQQLNDMRDQYRALNQATGAIATAMTSGQSRGQWGEMQLERILESAGLLPGVHFDRQVSVLGEEASVRPDVLIRLPAGGRIPVDAKFPFDAYWLALAEKDPIQAGALMDKHAKDVSARVNELVSRKYAQVAQGVDFAVMFLPFESLLSAAIQADATLLERAFDKRVVIATPTTMLALLRTIAFGFDRKLMQDNAEEIRDHGAQMLRRLGILAEHLADLRAGLAGAVSAYNKFTGSFDSQAMVQARRMQELGVHAQRALHAPETIDEQLRLPREDQAS